MNLLKLRFGMAKVSALFLTFLIFIVMLAGCGQTQSNNGFAESDGATTVSFDSSYSTIIGKIVICATENNKTNKEEVVNVISEQLNYMVLSDINSEAVYGKAFENDHFGSDDYVNENFQKKSSTAKEQLLKDKPSYVKDYILVPQGWYHIDNISASICRNYINTEEVQWEFSDPGTLPYEIDKEWLEYHYENPVFDDNYNIISRDYYDSLAVSYLSVIEHEPYTVSNVSITESHAVKEGEYSYKVTFKTSDGNNRISEVYMIVSTSDAKMKVNSIDYQLNN